MNKETWNRQVEHPLQSWQWGEFRKLTGVEVVRESGLQVTIHQIPHTKYTIGYAPKSVLPLGEVREILGKVASEHNCIFIKIEPKVEIGVQPTSYGKQQMKELGFVEGRPLFTKYNFVLDVTPSESELLASFKQKTRYNIRLAQKHEVKVEIDNSEKAFKKYLELTQETTKRQGFYAHTPKYHSTMWSVLGENQAPNPKSQTDSLSAQLLVAKLRGEIITTWMLFRFKDTLYYPYGASTREHREVMANNLVMWEAIRLAKAWGCKYLDMWGALSPTGDKRDPWYGFHSFKEGYGGRHVEYLGSFDYVERPLLYKLYRVLDWLRSAWLRFSASFAR